MVLVCEILNHLFRYQKKCDEMEVKTTQTRMTYDQMIADRDEIIHYLEGVKRQKSRSNSLDYYARPLEECGEY